MSGRNQSMEFAKLIASAFVVFIHVHFPGRFGEMVDYIGSFAVPMFFMITGYFNFHATEGQARRRLWHIVKLYALGVGAYLVWQAVWIAIQGGTPLDFLYRVLPDQAGLTKWIVVQEQFLVGHLWYVHALVMVYALYWAYLRFFQGKDVPRGPIYGAGFLLLCLTLVIGVIVPLYDELFPNVCRNAWLMGLPMFILGMFLREYQELICERFALTSGKLVLVVALGALLTLQQWLRFSNAFPFGTLLAAPALLLLLAQHPTAFGGGTAVRLGAWSVWIYLFHLIVDEAYGVFVQQALHIYLGELEDWLHPIFIFLASAALAALIDAGARALRACIAPKHRR